MNKIIHKLASRFLASFFLFFYTGGTLLVFITDYIQDFVRLNDNPFSMTIFYIVGILGTIFGGYLWKNKL